MLSDQRNSLNLTTIEPLECPILWFRLGISTEAGPYAIVSTLEEGAGSLGPLAWSCPAGGRTTDFCVNSFDLDQSRPSA